MPELPEIETIRRLLKEGSHDNPSLLGEVINEAHILWHPTIAMPSSEEFRKQVVGQIVRDIQRRGKYLIINLSADFLLLHLRMSGDLLIEKQGSPKPLHGRVVLDFISGRRLTFNDPRKFGRAWLVSDPQKVLSELGFEPLDSEFTPQEFYRILKSHRRQIKPLLMDQRVIAGLGNIYTDEALHMARLHPITSSNKIDQKQAVLLWQSIKDTLEEGIRRNGSSIDWVYRGGDYQNHFRVYQRNGKPCEVCGTIIDRIVVGQRGTHFCPHCQKEPS